MALVVDRELRAMAGGLEALALSPNLASGDLRAFRREAETLATRHFPGGHIVLATLDGQQLLNTLVPEGEPLPQRRVLEALRRVAETGRPAVSDLGVGSVTGRPAVTVEVPVLDTATGRVTRVLTLVPPLSGFAEIIHQQRPGPGWVVSVVDRAGVNVARVPNPERFVARPVSDTLRPLLAARAEGHAETVSLEGTPLLTAWSRPVGFDGWGVAIGVPRAEVYAPLRSAAAYAAAAFALALVGGMLLAARVAAGVARPVRALMRLVEDTPPHPGRPSPTAPGVDDAPPRLGLHEADEVGRALLAARRAEAEENERLRLAREALARSETELRRLNRGLERRVAEEVAAREAARARLAHAQRMEALGQLAGGVAHDFNNVLQAVGGGARLIEGRPDGPVRVRRLAAMMAEAAARGSAVTRRLLAFSRRADLRAEPLDAAELLAGTAEVLAHTLGDGVAVLVDAAPDLPPVRADKGQLETVLVNLATNARDAMSGQGTVTFGAEAREVGAGAHGLRPGSYLRLSVADTGAGMTPEVLARVTEPFFTTKERGKGTGLGLAMARGFAEQSGGALVIESALGRGTTVAVWLPVATESPPPAALPPVPGPAAGRTEGRARLLVVDDDPLVREVTAEGLREAGFAVAAVEGATEALELIEVGEPVDLVIADLSMPGVDGLALIRETQRRRPGLPAILLTGFVTDAAELAVGGAVSGSFSLLRKPVEPRALAERAAALLEEAETGEEAG